MNCTNCQQSRKIGAKNVKYIATVECRPAGRTDARYGMLYVQVGKNYIGKRYRVIIEEVGR